MSIDAPAGVAVIESTSTDRDNSSYVDWQAIIAGIVLASAISLVLISFGSAVGLNFLDFGMAPVPIRSSSALLPQPGSSGCRFPASWLVAI